MDQHSLRTEYKVGIFVAIGLIVSMVSILLLGGNRVVFTRYVNIGSDFTEVQGLFPGAVVSLVGLPVGNVKKIEFVPGGSKLRVWMQIDRIYGERIVKGTTAEIRTQGALGDKYVYLAPGPAGSPALADGDQILASEDGDIIKMLTDKEQGIGQVIDLIKEMRIMVASINANNRAGNLMQNLVQASNQINTTMARLDSLIGAMHNQIPDNQKLKSAITDLASILAKLDQGKGTLGALINDPSIHQNLKAFLGGSPRQNYLKNVIHETIQQSDTKK
jgi:phospholipid/cholesterol/gamma-HCH transport system substrate-binding protein